MTAKPLNITNDTDYFSSVIHFHENFGSYLEWFTDIHGSVDIWVYISDQFKISYQISG